MLCGGTVKLSDREFGVFGQLPVLPGAGDGWMDVTCSTVNVLGGIKY